MIKNLLFLLVFIVISSNNYARQRKIIDVHFHSRSAGDYGSSAPPNPVTGKVPKANSNQEICSENLMMLKKYNIPSASTVIACCGLRFDNCPIYMVSLEQINNLQKIQTKSITRYAEH